MHSFLARIQRKDAAILMIFNSSIRCKLLDYLMPAVTYLGSSIFGAIFCVFTLFNRNLTIRILGEKVTIALILSFLIARIIKISVNRNRPYLILKDLNTRKIGTDNYSFPSGHTTAAFCIASMLALTLPEFSLLTILLAVLVGISRMYLGVHYPTDVLVGMALGTVSSLLVYTIL